MWGSARWSFRNPAIPSMAGSFGAVLCGLLMAATPAAAQSRGELLYSTHCSACHTEQVHWRDGRVATDWSSLKAEVRKWQGAAALGWREGDVLEVARYLNDSIYHFKQGDEPLFSLDAHQSSRCASSAQRRSRS